jgi:hypothetical protein
MIEAIYHEYDAIGRYLGTRYRTHKTMALAIKAAKKHFQKDPFLKWVQFLFEDAPSRKLYRTSKEITRKK